MSKIVIAYYDKADHAQQVGKALPDAGIAAESFSVLDEEGAGNGQGLLKGGTSGQALIGELGQLGISQDEGNLYVQGLQHGGGLLVARIEDAQVEKVTSIVEQQPVVDIEQRARDWRNEGMEQGRQSSGKEGETVQSVEEELHVGKRETGAGHVLIHTHVEERPFEERIRLREEELKVERRPVSRTLSSEEAEKALQERTVEVSATREQAVVSKQARVVEEISVSKQQSEREEVVRGTVRKTKVDVEEKDLEKQGA